MRLGEGKGYIRNRGMGLALGFYKPPPPEEVEDGKEATPINSRSFQSRHQENFYLRPTSKYAPNKQTFSPRQNPQVNLPTKQTPFHPEQLPHFGWHQFALPQKSLPDPQKLLPLQHSPLAHFAFTIGPQVSAICAVLAGAVGMGGGVRLVAQSPKPGWQPAAAPQ